VAYTYLVRVTVSVQIPYCGNRTLSTVPTVQVPDVLVMVVDELSHGVHRVDVFYKKEDSPYEKE
jgi:hypothetical protein